MITKNDMIAVVVVNFNGGDMLLQCLQSIVSQSVSPSRIIVVDNASTDNSINAAIFSFPEIEFVRLNKNMGFAAANNYAVHLAAGCKWIALLNPDAWAAPDWLEKMITAAYAHPEFSFYGCCMYSKKDFSRLDGIGDIYHASGFAWRDSHGQTAAEKEIVTKEIFSACAAAVLYNRDAFLSVGGLDEDFFCYLEDVDLGFRLHLAGHRCLLVSNAVVHHAGSALAGGKHGNFAVYHGHRNLVWTYVKNMPGLLFWLFLPLHLIFNMGSIILFYLRGQGTIIIQAKKDALLGLPQMWKKRCIIQKHNIASINDIWKVLDKRLFPDRLHHSRIKS